MDKFEWIKNVSMYWIDRFGFIRTKKVYQDSGNGMLYMAYFMMRLARLFGAQRATTTTGAVDKFYNEVKKKPGLLMRTPENSYGVESHDNYRGLVFMCLLQGNTKIPREVLLYGLTHAFCYHQKMPTSLKEVWNGFLGKHLDLMALYWIAAFPKLNNIFYPLFVIYGLCETFPKDQSGAQLCDIHLQSLDIIYGFDNPIRSNVTKKSRAVCFDIYVIDSLKSVGQDPYYDQDHAFRNMPGGYIRVW